MFGKALVEKGVVFLDNSSGIKICSKYVQYRYCIKFHEKRNVLLNFFRFFTKWNYFCWNILNICHKAELWWYSAKFSMRLQFVTSMMVSGKHWTALCSLWPCWQWPVCVLATSTLNISMCLRQSELGVVLSLSLVYPEVSPSIPAQFTQRLSILQHQTPLSKASTLHTS